MKCINNPALLAGGYGISVDFIMASPTNRSEVFIAAKPWANSSRLVVNVLAFILSAAFAYGMEDKIRLFCLCVLLVFTLALGGCIPQPSAAFEALRPFEWSF